MPVEASWSWQRMLNCKDLHNPKLQDFNSYVEEEKKSQTLPSNSIQLVTSGLT